MKEVGRNQSVFSFFQGSRREVQISYGNHKMLYLFQAPRPRQRHHTVSGNILQHPIFTVDSCHGMRLMKSSGTEFSTVSQFHCSASPDSTIAICQALPQLVIVHILQRAPSQLRRLIIVEVPPAFFPRTITPGVTHSFNLLT